MGKSRIYLFLDEIRYEQTLFSLPMIYVGALYGSKFSLNLYQAALIAVAAAFARASGMLLNRLFDISIDRLNPRTKNRNLASGKLKPFQAILFLIFCLLIYLFAAYLLGPVPLKLSWIPVVMFAIYPLTKRFTWFCHFFLGLTHGLAPLAGWIAVNPKFTLEPFFLYFASFFWVSGFDIYYATMDYEFDKTHGVHSVPARFGLSIVPFLTVSLHALAILSLFFFAFKVRAGIMFLIFLVAGAIYLLRNDLLNTSNIGTPKINLYLQKNSYFSILILSGAIFDYLFKVIL